MKYLYPAPKFLTLGLTLFVIVISSWSFSVKAEVPTVTDIPYINSPDVMNQKGDVGGTAEFEGKLPYLFYKSQLISSLSSLEYDLSGINDRGDVVGHSRFTSPDSVADVFFIPSGGTAKALSRGSDIQGVSINNERSIVVIRTHAADFFNGETFLGTVPLPDGLKGAYFNPFVLAGNLAIAKVNQGDTALYAKIELGRGITIISSGPLSRPSAELVRQRKDGLFVVRDSIHLFITDLQNSTVRVDRVNKNFYPADIDDAGNLIGSQSSPSQYVTHLSYFAYPSIWPSNAKTPMELRCLFPHKMSPAMPYGYGITDDGQILIGNTKGLKLISLPEASKFENHCVKTSIKVLGSCSRYLQFQGETLSSPNDNVPEGMTCTVETSITDAKRRAVKNASVITKSQKGTQRRCTTNTEGTCRFSFKVSRYVGLTLEAPHRHKNYQPSTIQFDISSITDHD